MMKQTISVLSLLLVAQIGLAVGLNMGGPSLEAFEPQGKLLADLGGKIDRLEIRNKEGDTVTIARKDDNWVLPDVGDFPVAKDKVDDVIDQLTTLPKGYPVATSDNAAKRFKVSEEEFETRITFFEGGDEKAKLFMGTSPSYRYVHARPEGDDNVYTVSFNAYEAGAKVRDWADKSFLNTSAEEMSKATFPSFTLERTGESDFKLADAKASEKLDRSKAEEVFDQIARLSFEDVLGTEAKDTYGLKKPVLEFSVTKKEGNDITFQLGQLEGKDDYVLKASNHPYYFKMTKWSAERFINKKRAGLMVEDKDDNKETKTKGS